jgi:hypothetical protein
VANEPATPAGKLPTQRTSDPGFIFPQAPSPLNIKPTCPWSTALAWRADHQKDVLAFIDQDSKPQPAAAPAQPHPVKQALLSSSLLHITAARRSWLIPHTTYGVHAEHMVLSKHTSPHVTTVMEADGAALLLTAWRIRRLPKMGSI